MGAAFQYIGKVLGLHKAGQKVVVTSRPGYKTAAAVSFPVVAACKIYFSALFHSFSAYIDQFLSKNKHSSPLNIEFYVQHITIFYNVILALYI